MVRALDLTSEELRGMIRAEVELALRAALAAQPLRQERPAPRPDPDAWMTTYEVCKAYRIGKGGLKKFVESGRIPVSVRVGRWGKENVMMRRSDVERALSPKSH